MIVLLTASVTPSSLSNIEVANPRIRLDQYVRSIKKWVRLSELSGFRLMVAENSGHDLGGSLEQRFLQGIDIVNVPAPTDASRLRGKGAMEAEMLDWVLGNVQASDSELMVKCTGRLFVRNFAHVARGLPERKGTVVIRSSLDQSVVDMRLFGASLLVWKKYLAGMSREIDDRPGHWLEDIVARRLAKARGDAAIEVCRFAERPRYEGISGTTGQSYGRLILRASYFLATPIEKLLRQYATRKFY